MEGEEGEGNESFNEWQQIQLESTIDIKNHLSVFPPSNHEGLEVPPQPPSPPAARISSQPSSDVASNAESENGRLSEPKSKMGNEISKRLKLLSSWVVLIGRRGCFRSGFWSFGSVSVVVAAAVLMYWRVQRWWRQWFQQKSHNHLLLLIKEKDQKISQLLLQISNMNHMLSARHKVPVLRVA